MSSILTYRKYEDICLIFYKKSVIFSIFSVSLRKKGAEMQQYSRAAYDALESKIQAVESELGEAMLSMGSGAGSDNNTWHDNYAFEEAKRTVDRLTVELRRLKGLWENALVVDGPDFSTEVGVGSVVVVDYGRTTTTVHVAGHYVVASERSDGVKDISTSSPLGAAILGHAVGDKVTFLAPSGREIEVCIKEIS